MHINKSADLKAPVFQVDWCSSHFESLLRLEKEYEGFDRKIFQAMCSVDVHEQAPSLLSFFDIVLQ